MVPICPERWCTEANERPKLTAIIQSHRLTLFGHIMRMDDNADAKRILLAVPSGGLEKTTKTSPHHVARHQPTGSETPPPYAPQSSRYGSEPPSVEDDVDVWCYAILELHARNNDDDEFTFLILLSSTMSNWTKSNRTRWLITGVNDDESLRSALTWGLLCDECSQYEATASSELHSVTAPHNPPTHSLPEFAELPWTVLLPVLH